MIEGKHIFFTYGNPETDKNPVLNYVDLQIPDGQIVGLFGENGAGRILISIYLYTESRGLEH